MDEGSCSLISRLDEGDDEAPLTQKIPKGNVDNSDVDDGGDLDELLSAALKDKQGFDILPILLKNPRLIQLAGPMGLTVFHVAAIAGNVRAVCKMISFMEERQDLKILKKVLMATNVNGDTAIHLAYRNGHTLLAYHLVQAEWAALYIVNNDGVTASEMQMKFGFSQVKDDRFFIRWAEIYSAINRGQDDVVATWLMRETDGMGILWHQDWMSETLLHAAVKAVGTAGMGPLEHLVNYMSSNRLTAAALIENIDGDTALHLGIWEEDLNVIHCLIKASPQAIYQRNHKGETPFFLAIEAGHQELVKHMCEMLTKSCLTADAAMALLEHTYASRVMDLAIQDRSLGILQTLMEHLPELIIDITAKIGQGPLTYAANKGCLDEVNYLITKFPEYVEKYERDGSLPIHNPVAGQRGRHVSIIQVVLKHWPKSLYHVGRKDLYDFGNPEATGADLEMRVVREALGAGSSGVGERWAHLYEAINCGQDNMVLMELTNEGDSKALLLLQDYMGETLLHAAVRAVGYAGVGSLEHLVQFIIRDSLTDVAVVGSTNGDTALHLAVRLGYLNAVNCLIKAAPRTVYQVNNNMGNSPLYVAIKRGHQDIVENMFQMLSESCPPDYRTEILLNSNNAALVHIAIIARSPGILKTVMEHLPELIKAKDEKGWSPLSYAANKGYLDEVNYLLTNFPKSVDEYDTGGYLPIHKAVGGGHISIIQAFIRHCPQSLHHVDEKGQTILHTAVRYAKADVLDYLTKEFKMDDSFLKLTDKEGKTFMDYAK